MKVEKRQRKSMLLWWETICKLLPVRFRAVYHCRDAWSMNSQLIQTNQEGTCLRSYQVRSLILCTLITKTCRFPIVRLSQKCNILFYGERCKYLKSRDHRLDTGSSKEFPSVASLHDINFTELPFVLTKNL